MHETIDLEAIATHEAGHVLLAHYYGRKVYGAYLQSRPASHSTGGERSHVRFALTPYIQDVHLDLTKLDERWPLAVRETLVTTRIRLAGPLAQSLHQQIAYRDMAGGQDYRDALSELLLLERLRLSLPQPHSLDVSYKHKNILDTLAEDILGLLNDAVYVDYLQRIAQDLLAKQELSARQISAILEAMPRHQWGSE
ncbi:MAG: hypothetical protein KBT88_09720 [Gammaproteobacteria bacterium]|nr:hypothetical protein [Gammaproteobacteria bacterium]MBQ0840052.1 hypothetical protein [Gammaproteobacteria bacterium]